MSNKADALALFSCIESLGGTVEGHPTARHNFLQRIRQLIDLEQQALKSLRTNVCKWCQSEGEPEWSPHTHSWIHRRDTLDRSCGAEPFKLPHELLGGAVKVVHPTDLRNRIGRYMLEEKGCKIGVKIDPGDVQSMIEEFVTRESAEAAPPEKEPGPRCPKLEELAQLIFNEMPGWGMHWWDGCEKAAKVILEKFFPASPQERWVPDAETLAEALRVKFRHAKRVPTWLDIAECALAALQSPPAQPSPQASDGGGK